MKIFIVGMPQSGRTTVAKALCQSNDYRYIDACGWVRSTFREPKDGERPQQYEDEFHSWFANRLKLNPQLIVNNVHDSIESYKDKEGRFAEQAYRFVIDGIESPRDFAQLFDYNKDVVVFLNRTGNQSEYKDYQNVGNSVMRDHCFWMSSADLLPKDRWFEYNFSIPGEDTDFVKALGQKNSVFIVRSIKRVISHLQEQISKIKFQ